MKTTTIFVMTLAAAGLLTGNHTLAQGVPDLTVFKGNYKGSVTQTGPGAGNSAKGRATVRFKVPGIGTSAGITFTAAMSDGMGGTNLLPTALTLKSNGRLSVTDLLIGIAGANNAKPGTGDWTQRRRVLKIDATNGEGITLRGKAVTRDLRARRKLTLILKSDDGVDTTTFDARLKARLPRRI